MQQLSGNDQLMAHLSGNLPDEWREEFSSTSDLNDWTFQTIGTALYSIDGNVAGSTYLKLTLDPTDPNASVTVYGNSSKICRTPYRQGWATSISRRSPYQYSWFGQTSATRDGTPAWNQTVAIKQVATYSGGIVVSANVATITTTTAHGLKVGDRIMLNANSDARVNFQTVVITVPTATTFTATCTIGNATYGSTGTVTLIDAGLGAQDHMGVMVVDTTVGNALSVSSAESLSNWVQTWNPGNTWDTAVVPNNVVNYSASYTYAFQPSRVVEFSHDREYLNWILSTVDATSAISSQISRDQAIPQFANGSLPAIKFSNFNFAPVPKRITAAVKSASSTATLTIPSHGLIVGDIIQIEGLRDQVNFANTIAVSVVSVTDANTITAAFGISATASSYGGYVIRQAANSNATFTTSSIQSISVTAAGRLQLNFAASQGTWVIGESIYLFGIVDSTNTAQAANEGLWRIARTDTTLFQVELEPMQGQTPTAVANCGGGFQAAPDFRVHFIRSQTHSRLAVEVEGGRGHQRTMNSVPVVTSANSSVAISGNAGVNLAQIAASTATNVIDNAGTNRSLGVFQVTPGNAPDVTTAARTTSGNSGVISSAIGATGVSAVINVTAVSGTTPILDITLEESHDNGATWQKVWDAPRITSVSTVVVPAINQNGRRRWSWVIGGTSPSFTFIITCMGTNQSKVIRQLIDRTIAPNTLNSSTPALNISGATVIGMQVQSGAGATVNPTYSLQLSHNGVDWFTQTGGGSVGPSTNQYFSVANIAAQFARISITSAGTGATHNFVVLTASEA